MSRTKSRQKEHRGADRTVLSKVPANGDAANDASQAPEYPEKAKPTSWTSEFCRRHANVHTDREEYAIARMWRFRAHVLDHFADVKILRKDLGHPYAKMKVDTCGREIAVNATPPEEQTAIMVAMHGATRRKEA